MKTITYPLVGGGKFKIEYDPTAPCIVCGNPVINASMGGTNVCPSCDIGRSRDGSRKGLHFIIWVSQGIDEVPTFHQVENVSCLMAARGIHARGYEWARDALLRGE